MHHLPPSLEKLIQALRILPSVGPKSAQRMAFTLLQEPMGAAALSSALTSALSSIRQCQRCYTYSEDEVCEICRQPARLEKQQVCIVSGPLDVVSFEQAGLYQGTYFVTHGLLSPIDGIGPEALNMAQLQSIINQMDAHGEIILALPASVEGEATSYYISQMAKGRQCKVTRLAQGLSSSKELSSIDSRTLAHAFSGRTHL